MRVVINAQIDPQRSGGIAQVIIGLADGLGKLDGEDEYVFVCSKAAAHHIQPHVGSNSRVVINSKPALPPVQGMRVSDGFWESFTPDVLHFPYQSYTKTDVPSVFNPHDLQHVHLPSLFTESERARREALYGQACHDAAAVGVTSGTVKHDMVGHFSLPPRKVHVIWWGAPTTAYDRPADDSVARLSKKLDLPARFAIYPAKTWPHKNHARLIEALRLLRDKHGVVVPLVCTGGLTEHHRELADLLTTHNMHEQVRFVGFVGECDLIALYALAEMMVVPTMFEAISLPVFEAFAEGVPVACSAVTSLPEQVGDAALLFDPEDPAEMASTIGRLHADSSLRSDLVERGRKRVAAFTWLKAAQAYRDVYRRISE